MSLPFDRNKAGPRRRRRGLLWGLLALSVFVVGLWMQWWPIPERHNPFAPFSFKDGPNWTTRFKLTRLSYQPELCLDVLKQSELKFSKAESFEQANGCRQRNPVRVTGSGIRYNAAFQMTCPAAVALASWQQHGLQTAARVHLKSEIVAIEHFGTYSCRNQYNRADTQLSEHAHANAIDIAGFRARDGQHISVLKHWKGSGDKARFLRAARDHACRSFNVVLSPDYNAAHQDHFHFDRAALIRCG